MSDEIKLRCRCGNEGSFERSIDPDIPPVVATILSDKCPKCDDGDRGSETYYDAQGRELEFGTWEPFKSSEHIH